MTLTTARLGLRYPVLSDTADVPRDVGNLAADIDNAAIFGVGFIASRPVSTSGSPGIAGRLYHATDLGIDKGDLWFDYSQGWRKIPLCQTDRSLWFKYSDADTQPSLRIDPATPKIDFGVGGTTATDTNIYRQAAADLRTDGKLFVMNNALSGGDSVWTRIGGQTGGGFSLNGDVKLWRVGAGALATDGSFRTLSGLAGQILLSQNAGAPAIYLGSAADTSIERTIISGLAAGVKVAPALQVSGYQVFPYGANLDINSAVISPTHTFHTVFTSGGTILTTINNSTEGRILILRNGYGGAITIDVTSNIQTRTGAAFVLPSGAVTMFIYDTNTAKWIQLY